MEEVGVVAATVDLRVSLEATVRPVAVVLLAPGMVPAVVEGGAESSPVPEQELARRMDRRVTKLEVRVVAVAPDRLLLTETTARSAHKAAAVVRVRPFYSIRWRVFLLVVVEVVLEVVLPSVTPGRVAVSEAQQ
jgi:hypothetical protein